MAKMNWRAIGPMVERQVPAALRGEGVAAMKPILEAVLEEFMRTHGTWIPEKDRERLADEIEEAVRFFITQATTTDGCTGKPYRRWLEVFHNGEQLVVDTIAGPPDLVDIGLGQFADDIRSRQLKLERLKRDYPQEFEDSEDEDDGDEET
jgi:hypothetical protein